MKRLASHTATLEVAGRRVFCNGALHQASAYSSQDCDRDTIVRFGTGYGLTRAEIRIVQFMLEGQGVDDIAGRLHGSVNTVRWHLKSIYAKSGAAGQADLIRLFMHAMHLSIV